MTDLLAIQRATGEKRAYIEPEPIPVSQAAETQEQLQLTPEQRRKAIERLRKEMQAAAKKLDFILAARLRDEMLALMALDEEDTSTQQK